MYASAGLVPRQSGPPGTGDPHPGACRRCASESPRVVGRAVTADGQYALMSVRVSSDLSEAEAVEPVRRFAGDRERPGCRFIGARGMGNGRLLHDADNMETITRTTPSSCRWPPSSSSPCLPSSFGG
jgi:hypothetical protein